MESSGPRPRIEGYTLLESLGRGGFGVVYRARQESLDREVALKLLNPGVTADPETLARFQREIDLQRDLVHPHLVRMLDAGHWDEGLYLALELVEGGSLSAWRRPTGIEIAKAVDVGLQTAQGLAFLHERGILHRDLKPANLLLTRDGQVKIGDYGLARTSLHTAITEPGAMLGTPEYMAPEALMGEDPSPASDVYSLGTILYEMVTGRPPFSASSILVLVGLVTQGVHAPARVLRSETPAWLDALIAGCLARDHARRLPLDQVLDILEQKTSSSPSGMRDLPPIDPIETRVLPSRPGPPSRRRLRPAPLAAGLATLLLVIGVTVWWTQHKEPRPRVTDLTASPTPDDVTQGTSGTTASPEEWVDRLEKELHELRTCIWSKRGAQLMHTRLHSQDRAVEFAVQREYRDLVELAIRVLETTRDDSDRATKLVCGWITQVALEQAGPVVVPRSSALAKEGLPRILDLVGQASKDPLLETIRASLRPFDIDSGEFEVARVAPLESLVSRLTKPREDRLELKYLVDILEGLIFVKRKELDPDRARIISSDEIETLRVRLVEMVATSSVRWPQESWQLRMAADSVADTLDEATTGVELRLRSLRSMIALCDLIPSSLPDHPDLAMQLERLQRIVRHRTELRASGQYASELAALIPCVERFDTRFVADPLGSSGPAR